MKKITKIIVLILVVLLILFTINTLRNYIILKNIRDFSINYSNLTEFSFVIKSNNETKILTKKDSIVKIENTTNNTLSFINLNNMKDTTLDTKAKTISQKTISDVSIDLDKTNLEDYNLFLVSMTNFIKSTTVNDIDCYVFNVSDTTYYVDKTNYCAVKVEINNETLAEYSNYRIDNIDSSEIAMPDISEYIILN